MLVYFDRQMGGNAMPVEEDHHVLDGSLLLPGLNEIFDAHAGLPCISRC